MQWNNRPATDNASTARPTSTRVLNRPARWPWIVGGISVAALVGVTALALTPAAKPKDAKTVEEVLNGSEIVRDDQQPTSDNDSALAELAKAMGLPQGAFSPDKSGRSVDEEATRSHLVHNLRESTKVGKLTEEEARAVVKAYDSGLVEPPVEAVILDSPGQ